MDSSLMACLCPHQDFISIVIELGDLSKRRFSVFAPCRVLYPILERFGVETRACSRTLEVWGMVLLGADTSGKPESNCG